LPYVLKDAWTDFSGTEGAPKKRYLHSAVWTGSAMIVWGGTPYVAPLGEEALDDGKLYDPLTDTWTPMSKAGAPIARGDFTGVWTGDKMIVWGGYNNKSNDALAAGGIYH